MYAATVDGAKQDILKSRVPGGHAGPKQSPVTGLQGDVYARDVVYNEDYLSNPNMPKDRGQEGSLAVQYNTGLSHDDRIDEQLLSWLHTNPLVTSPVVNHHTR